MTVATLDRRIDFRLFVKGMSQKLQSILARTLSPEEKFRLILDEMNKDTQAKRLTARGIRTRMVALSDPETANLEPLERLRAKRQKLIKLGGQLLKELEAATTSQNTETATLKAAQVGQVTQEIRALETPLSSMEATYTTLKESYEVALQNYRTALAGYEHARSNGPVILLAIRAHQDALKSRDEARRSEKQVDASFLNDLAGELEKAKGELRSDQEIDEEVDATQPSVNKLMAEHDLASTDEALMQEFRSA